EQPQQRLALVPIPGRPELEDLLAEALFQGGMARDHAVDDALDLGDSCLVSGAIVHGNGEALVLDQDTRHAACCFAQVLCSSVHLRLELRSNLTVSARTGRTSDVVAVAACVPQRPDSDECLDVREAAA